MSREISPKELESVLMLPDAKRYEHFIKQVADWGQIWSLRLATGWVLAADDQGKESIPVWPHEPYALLCATDRWDGGKAQSIPLPEWLDRWIPGIGRDARQIAVFPTPSGKGIVVSSDRLKQDLLAELERIE